MPVLPRRRAIVRAFLASMLLLGAVGCGVHPASMPQGSMQNAPPPTQPPPTATQSGSVSITPQYAALGLGQTLQFAAMSSSGGAVQWLVNGVAGGTASLGTVDATGLYTAPASLPQSANVTVTAALTASPATDYANAVMSVIHPGAVTGTANPQVADYSIYLPAPGNVSVEFGPTTAYGRPTWSQPTPGANGGQVNLLVAGMLAKTNYHMRARVTLSDGATFIDTDQRFLTGTPPQTTPVIAGVVNGGAPQPGIELFDTLIPHSAAQAFATDLNGNVLWTYSYTGTSADGIQPIKLLPNGHFLVQLSYASSIALRGQAIRPGTLDEVREVDLAGNTIRTLTQASLAAALTAQGYTFTLGSLHHDVLALPNGHMVLLGTVSRTFTDLPGYPGSTAVLGDVLIDVDQQLRPDWVWNSFDHLDVNRHPYLFPDWTHSNSLLYSADDHDLVLSLRHQNWLIKIDFNDGQGSGNILWRLGEGGDFKLSGGTDPKDWFYAQHGPAFFTPSTAGVFELGVMDNGDDRELSPGGTCAGQPQSCNYSTAEVFQIDEASRTATLLFHYVPPPSMYSFFGGNVDPLANGDVEADFCGVTTGSVVQELTFDPASPRLVWQAVTKNANQYRAERLPSLYPGVQW